MKNQIIKKINQLFYRSPKQVDGKRVSTSLGTFEKEIGSAMDSVFRADKKGKRKKAEQDNESK